MGFFGHSPPRSFLLPKKWLVANVLGLQGGSLQELVAEAVVEGTVQLRRAAVSVQDAETLHLVLSVHQQLRFVAIYSDQNHVLQDGAHVAAEEFIGNPISENLQKMTQNERISGAVGDQIYIYSFLMGLKTSTGV